MSRTKVKQEPTSDDTTDSTLTPKIKCEFYPQDISHHFPQIFQQFQCGICSAVLEEEAFTDHVRSHYHPPIKCEPEEEEDVKPALPDIVVPEIDIPDIPVEEDKEPTNERSFPFPIVDYQQNMISNDSQKSNVIYTCMNPNNLYYKCEKCTFTASKQTVLNEHKKTHKSNALKCSKCSFYTTSKEMYAMHCRKHRKRPIADVEPIDIKPENVF